MYRLLGCCFFRLLFLCFSVCYLCRNMLFCQYTFEGKCFCIYRKYMCGRFQTDILPPEGLYLIF